MHARVALVLAAFLMLAAPPAHARGFRQQLRQRTGQAFSKLRNYGNKLRTSTNARLDRWRQVRQIKRSAIRALDKAERSIRSNDLSMAYYSLRASELHAKGLATRGINIREGLLRRPLARRIRRTQNELARALSRAELNTPGVTRIGGTMPRARPNPMKRLWARGRGQLRRLSRALRPQAPTMAVIRQNNNVMRWVSKAEEHYSNADRYKQSNPKTAAQEAWIGQRYEYKAQRMMSAIQRKLARNPGLEPKVIKALQQQASH